MFLAEFWTSLFKILRTDLLVTTAYHPQTDGQSERTNQIVEIALRHLVNNTKSDWSLFLGDVEFTINNSVHSSTGVSLMKFLIGLDAPTPLTVAASTSAAASEWSHTRNEIQQAARDALVFAQAKMSIYYNKKHKPLLLKPGDKAYISLAGSMETGYHLPNTISHKLSPQRVGPFQILRSVGRLAYELDIPSTWKIHPVISIAHLEPHKEDTYGRDPTPVPDIVDDDSSGHEEWEVEDIVAERHNKRRKRQEWLVKWKGFGPEQNTWEPVDNLTNASDKIEDFRRARDPITTASTYFLPSMHPPPMENAFLTTIFSR